MIDDTELEIIQSIAAPIKKLIAEGRYDEAGSSLGEIYDKMDMYSNNIDYYNFLVFREPDRSTNKRTNGE